MNPPPQIAFRFGRISSTGGVSQAFSLIELLVTMGIIAVLTSVAMPALNSLNGAGKVNKAVADLSGTLEMARVYAMANRTYVRVLISKPVVGKGKLVPATVVLAVVSPDDSPGMDITEAKDWPSLSRPLVLEDLLAFDSLQGNADIADTRNDVVPLNDAKSFTRVNVPGWGNLEFNRIVQFGPTGEASLGDNEPVRYIKLAMDRPVPGNTASNLRQNPFILRLSGINGSIRTLRAEDIAL